MKLKSLLIAAFAVASLSAWSLDVNFGTPGHPNLNSMVDVTIGDDGVTTLKVLDKTDPWIYSSVFGTTLDPSSTAIVFDYKSTAACRYEFYFVVAGGAEGTKHITNTAVGAPDLEATGDEWLTVIFNFKDAVDQWGFGTSPNHRLRFDLVGAEAGTEVQIKNFEIAGTPNPRGESATLKVGTKTTIDANMYDEGGEGVAFHYSGDDPFFTDAAGSGRTDGTQQYTRIVPTGWRNGKGLGNMGINFATAYDGKVTNGNIAWDDAVYNRGSWYNYTITADEDVDADIDLGANVDFGTFNTISRSRQAAGYGNAFTSYTDLDGNTVNSNYAQDFTACAMVALDGKLLESTQESIPNMSEIDDAELYTEAATDASKTDWVQVADKRILHILPSPSDPTNRNVMPMQKDKFGTPFFKGVHISKGTHVLRVYGLAQQWDFGGIVIESNESSAVEAVKVADDNVKVYAGVGTIYSNVPAAVYNVAGAQVAKVNGTASVPAGIYIVKAGSKAVKVLVK